MTTAPQGDTEPGLQVYLTFSTPHSSTRNQASFSPSKPGEAVDESTANNYHGVWVLRPSGRFSGGAESNRKAPSLRPSSS